MEGVGRKLALVAGVLIVFILVAAEFVARLSGVAQLPVFRVDPRIGYYPAPNQQGVFLHRNRWAFNNRSMGVEEPYRLTSDGVLLVGDSVVYGGNPLDQSEKLGPLLSGILHRPVWPLAAGGWALENELRMVEANPDLLSIPTLIWVSNTGDFGEEEPWANPVNYPDHRPWSALLYGLRKTALKPRDTVESRESPQATRLWEADLRAFLSRYHGRLIWVLYPDKAEAGRHQARFDELLRVLDGRAQIVDLTQAPNWRTFTYRDGIHPDAPGDHVFARILAHGAFPNGH